MQTVSHDQVENSSYLSSVEFSLLAEELLSPQDRAIYEEYANGRTQLINYLKTEKEKVDAEIREKSKISTRRKIVEFFSPKIKEQHKRELCMLGVDSRFYERYIKDPDRYIREKEMGKRIFVELPAGAKQYAMLKEIVDKATRAGETDVNKIIELYKIFSTNIQDYPLIHTSSNDCLCFIKPGQYKEANSWDDIVKNAEVIKADKEQTEELSDIKHVSLTKFFKGHFCDKYSEVIDILSKCKVDKEAGCLPPEWISIIPKEQVSTKTKEIS